MIDPNTLLGAAVALFALAASAAVLYWPEPPAVCGALLRHADREADFRGLWPARRRVVRRIAERLALDAHEGRVTLAEAMRQVSAEAASRW